MATWTSYDLETTPALDDEVMIYDSSEASGTNNRMLMAYAMRQYSGTAFPVSNLWDGMPFWRTDIGAGLGCFYDATNTQWLTQQIYHAWFEAQTVSADGYLADSVSIGTTYAPYVVRATARTKVLTTNDGSNYWTVTYRSLNTGDTAVDMASFTTASDSADTNTEHNVSSISTPNPANYSTFWLYAAKTSSPGNLILRASIYYHLIIT